MISSEAYTVQQCQRCSLNKARGTRMIYEDGAIDFKCNICGKTMRIGYTEQSNTVQMEAKRGRERAEQNRSRYQREKFDEYMDGYTKAKEDPYEKTPDASETLAKMSNPVFREHTGDEEDGDEIPFVPH